MNPFLRLLGAGGAIEEKSADYTEQFFAALLGGNASKSGVGVNIETALEVPTVLACTRVIADGVSQIPLKLYQEHDDGTKVVAKDHPLHKIISRRPNDYQTSYEWRETGAFHQVLAEGSFDRIYRRPDGSILELIPITPNNIKPKMHPILGLLYEFHANDGAPPIIMKREEIHHVRGPSWNGYRALAMIDKSRETIGLAIAAQDTLARLHSNGTRPSGVLTAPGKLGKEQLDRIKVSFAEAYSGTQNAFKTIVLDGGMVWAQTSVNPKDAQSEETRMRQVEEICRTLKVFPQMIGYSDKTATYASAEAFFGAHVIHTLLPWCERREQAISRDLLSAQEIDQGYFAKFSVDGLLRGDAKSRAEYYASGIVNGWLTRNEARRLEDKDPLAGLDEPLVPLNMGTKANQQAASDLNQKAHHLQLALDRLGLSHLEGKVGRVLSAVNEGRLAQARDLLDQVLAQVEAQPEE